MTNQYLHGYTDIEQQRLLTQARIAEKYIFPFFDLTNCQHLLEIGMGVGAQTLLFLEKFPHLQIIGIESSPKQIAQAEKNLATFPEYQGRYQIIHGDAKSLSHLNLTNIDVVIFIWVLEHIPQPEQVLSEIYRTVTPGTIIYLTEVCNHSLYLYPPSPAVMNFWQKSITFQSTIGGDGNIGVRLGSLLQETGYQNIQVQPCVKFFDSRQLAAKSEFISFWQEIMASMLEGMIQAGQITPLEWESVQQEMHDLIHNPQSILYYHSMQAVAKV